jgi:hypothetical protein
VKATTRTPAEIFGYHLRYVVPLFQRPYVWTEDDQWEPLWNDVKTLADRLLDTAPERFGASNPAPHFLGAIVVEQQAASVGFIAVWHVVDGQQRLTTLQLLLDAAQLVVEQHGSAMDAQALRILIRNEPSIAQHPDEVYKVWPTDRDQEAFRAAMDSTDWMSVADAPNRVMQAHAYFQTAVREWAEIDGDPDKAVKKLSALVRALREHLKVVVIDLEPGDNAQVIFETLNHRGSPLLAADLIKNLIFQRASAHELDVLDLYRKYWRQLDSDHWRGDVQQGRLYRPRIDVFLNYWLTMKLIRDVSSDRVYADFRDQVAMQSEDIGSLLAEIARDAGIFSQLDKLPPSTPEGIFYYRVVRALDAGVVTPVLLWLLRWPDDQLPVDQRRRALRAIESWLVRRTLARLTTKAINTVVLDLLKSLDKTGPLTAGDRTEEFLASQTADSRLWPDDGLVSATLAIAPIYTAVVRPRLRMVLEALEDDARTAYGEGEPAPRNLSVEHVMPQSWTDNWPLPDQGSTSAASRDQLVHRLGNLTLVSGKLNPALSNRPWTQGDGRGKRDYLLQHSSLKLNARIVSDHVESWTDEDIESRTTEMAERICRLWPRPSGASATPMAEVAPSAYDAQTVPPAPVPDDDRSDPNHTGKYRDLWRWLRDQPGAELHLSFGEVEDILGMSLPPSARDHLPHWHSYDGSALARAIIDAGRKASRVNLEDERVTFVRSSEA